MKLKNVHRIYTRIMARSSVLFLPCLMIFVILCLIFSIKVDVINTYSTSGILVTIFNPSPSIIGEYSP